MVLLLVIIMVLSVIIFYKMASEIKVLHSELDIVERKCLTYADDLYSHAREFRCGDSVKIWDTLKFLIENNQNQTFKLYRTKKYVATLAKLRKKHKDSVSSAILHIKPCPIKDTCILFDCVGCIFREDNEDIHAFKDTLDEPCQGCPVAASCVFPLDKCPYNQE